MPTFLFWVLYHSPLGDYGVVRFIALTGVATLAKIHLHHLFRSEEIMKRQRGQDAWENLLPHFRLYSVPLSSAVD